MDSVEGIVYVGLTADDFVQLQGGFVGFSAIVLPSLHLF